MAVYPKYISILVVATTLIQAIIIPHPLSCNRLLCGLPAPTLIHTQSILHTAARILLLKHKSDNYHSLHCNFQWFPITQKIKSKLYQRLYLNPACLSARPHPFPVLWFLYYPSVSEITHFVYLCVFACFLNIYSN